MHVTSNEGLPLPRRYLAMGAIMCAIIMGVLDSATLNVALPTIARQLNVLPETVIWIVTAYQIALVSSLLAFAALGDAHGYRKIFTTGLALFVAASIVCSLSRSFASLLIARTAVGLACASIFGVSTALVRFSQPRARLGRVVGSIALLVAVCLAAGPTIGSTIMSVADWRAIFLISVPFGLAALFLSKALPDTERSGRGFDWTSAALNALVLALLITGLGFLIEHPAWSLSAIAISTVGGVLLIRHQSKVPAPLVPVDLMRIRPFAAAISASACCFAAQSCAFIGLPFFLQYDLALGHLETGLLLTSWPVAVAITAPIAGRLADHIPAEVLCSAGAGMLSLGLLILAIHPAGAMVGLLFTATVIAGIGFGCFQAPNNRAMLLAAPIERSGAAGGMQATARQFGQAIAAALVALAFTAFHHQAQIALLIGTGLAAAAAAFSLLRSGPLTR